MGNMFSVPILGAVAHSEETKKILTPYAFNRRQSFFIRKAIVSFAKGKDFDEMNNIGFEMNNIGLRPKYIPVSIWQKIIKSQQKSYGVNYTYAIAFYWLLSLPEFKGYNKSKLMREIIEDTANGHL
jgi:hypothetical protein